MISGPGMMAHAFNSSTWKAEAVISPSLRQGWSTYQAPRQPGLLKEILSQANK